MAFVTGGEDLLDGHPGGSPSGSRGTKTRDSTATRRPRCVLRGNEQGDHPTVPLDRDSLSPLRGAQELGESGFGFGSRDLSRGIRGRLF